MKDWTGKDYGFYIGGIVLTYALFRAIAMLCGSLTVSTPVSLALMALLPCLCSALVTRRLKKQGKGVWLTLMIPAVFVLLWGVLSLDLPAAKDFVAIFTGYDDYEAAGFFLLFALLFCGGLLAGAVLGACLRSPEQT